MSTFEFDLCTTLGIGNVGLVAWKRYREGV